MRDIQRTYSIFIIAWCIVLVLHVFLLLFIRYYALSEYVLEGSAGLISSNEPSVSFELPPFIESSSPAVIENKEEFPSKSEKDEEEDILEDSTSLQPTTNTSSALSETSLTVQENKSDESLKSLPFTEQITSTAPQRLRRSLAERKAQWSKKAALKTPQEITDNARTLNPFKQALDMHTNILNKSKASSVSPRNGKGNAGRTVSHSYNVEEQAVATMRFHYMTRVGKKLAEHTKFFHRRYYIKEPLQAHTITVIITWNKQGKIIEYKTVQEGINKEINDTIKDFFMKCTLPFIPPQLADTYNYTFTIYVEQTPQGFATFSMRAQ